MEGNIFNNLIYKRQGNNNMVVGTYPNFLPLYVEGNRIYGWNNLAENEYKSKILELEVGDWKISVPNGSEDLWNYRLTSINPDNKIQDYFLGTIFGIEKIEEKEEEKQFLFILIFSGIFIIVFVGVLVFFFIRKNKLKKKIDIKETELEESQMADMML